MRTLLISVLLMFFAQSSMAAWCCNYRIKVKKTGKISYGQACTGGSEPNCVLYQRAWTNCAKQRSRMGHSRSTAACLMTAKNDCSSDDGETAKSYWKKCNPVKKKRRRSRRR